MQVVAYRLRIGHTPRSPEFPVLGQKPLRDQAHIHHEHAHRERSSRCISSVPENIEPERTLLNDNGPALEIIFVALSRFLQWGMFSSAGRSTPTPRSQPLPQVQRDRLATRNTADFPTARSMSSIPGVPSEPGLSSRSQLDHAASPSYHVCLPVMGRLRPLSVKSQPTPNSGMAFASQEKQAHRVLSRQRLASVAISPRPSRRSSAVTRVRPSTLAVAARKRSAGSGWGSGSCCAASTIS
jgi:hypothetical protein